MTPAAFESQMNWLLLQDYHFVTGPEMVGYLEGWLELPAQSIILTTDSGNSSMKSLPRMVTLFQGLEEEFGYAPHVISFIWTSQMEASESKRCTDNLCWRTFREALDSGYFSFGTHTESHADLGKMTYEDGRADLLQSRREIMENLGVFVYGISWPFESCPTWMDNLPDQGFIFGLGGRSRIMVQEYAYQEDNLAMCLPRLFPPNPSGVSGRPPGKTLEEMLFDAQVVDPQAPVLDS